MKRLIATVLVGALVVAVAAISAAPAGAAKGGTDRPYKASGDGTNDINLAACIPALPQPGEFVPVSTCPQMINQTVIGTHIGKSTRTTTGSIELRFYLFGTCFGPDGTTPGFPIASTQEGTLEAANGDQLYFEEVVDGCFVDFGIDSQPSGDYTITGGTGRFEGATGEGTLQTSTFGLNGLTTEWVGSISY